MKNVAPPQTHSIGRTVVMPARWRCSNKQQCLDNTEMSKQTIPAETGTTHATDGGQTPGHQTINYRRYCEKDFLSYTFQGNHPTNGILIVVSAYT